MICSCRTGTCTIHCRRAKKLIPGNNYNTNTECTIIYSSNYATRYHSIPTYNQSQSFKEPLRAIFFCVFLLIIRVKKCFCFCFFFQHKLYTISSIYMLYFQYICATQRWDTRLTVNDIPPEPNLRSKCSLVLEESLHPRLSFLYACQITSIHSSTRKTSLKRTL